jgi:hypothetical protein
MVVAVPMVLQAVLAVVVDILQVEALEQAVKEIAEEVQ